MNIDIQFASLQIGNLRIGERRGSTFNFTTDVNGGTGIFTFGGGTMKMRCRGIAGQAAVLDRPLEFLRGRINIDSGKPVAALSVGGTSLAPLRSALKARISAEAEVTARTEANAPASARVVIIVLIAILLWLVFGGETVLPWYLQAGTPICPNGPGNQRFPRIFSGKQMAGNFVISTGSQGNSEMATNPRPNPIPQPQPNPEPRPTPNPLDPLPRLMT